MQYPLQHPHLQVQNIRTFTVCQNMLFLWASLFLLCTNVNSFNLNPITKSSTVNNRMAIFMGRAAAVRAATKAKTDMAKTKNNARYGKKIAIAIKAGGADPLVNRNLAQVIAEAKAAQVPNDVIKRNLDKGSTSTADYKQSIFEFYGHGGVGLLVNVLTDNDNRASQDVSLVAKKNSLKTATANSVAFKFHTKARLDLSTLIDEDKLLEICLECDVEDYELRTAVDGNPLNPSDEGKCVIYVESKDMASLRDALRSRDFVLETSLAAVPKEGTIAISDEDFDLNMAAIEAFEALDDVDSVEHNIDMVGDD